ncbi:class I SAM-dependent methyltransferase [Ohtaekwangia kribbensis]|uniref:Class I SAM-dependent methyltransferase n=1 Tax=Ohtaekwangia kribbensis TaxID=688913 RepID=A0ABW3K7N4_9BACT
MAVYTSEVKNLKSLIHDCMLEKAICQAKITSDRLLAGQEETFTWFSARPDTRTVFISPLNNDEILNRDVASLLADEDVHYIKIFSVEQDRDSNRFEKQNFVIRDSEDILCVTDPGTGTSGKLPDIAVNHGKNIATIELYKETIANVGGRQLYSKIESSLKAYSSNARLDMVVFRNSKGDVAFVNCLVSHDVSWVLTVGIHPEENRMELFRYILETLVHSMLSDGVRAVVLQAPAGNAGVYSTMGFSHFGNLKVYDWSRATHYISRENLMHPSVYPASGILKKDTDFITALDESKCLGIPFHEDLPKNWDSLAALSTVLRYTDTRAKILDAGGEYYSSILPQLAAYNYKNLTCINLAFKIKSTRGTIIYQPGDITATDFDDEYFDGVTCLSVIEHGIDLHACFREMNRIIKTEGYLFISTDYWEDYINTDHISAYGASSYIFNRDSIASVIQLANAYGFQLLEPLHLDGVDKVVEWKEFNTQYTFIYFTLQKVSSYGKN